MQWRQTVIAFAILIMCAGGIVASTLMIALAYERPDPSRCQTCDYDIRGSPYRICPECGLENPAIENLRRRVTQPALFGLGIALFVITALPIIVYFGVIAYHLFSGR